MSTIGLDIAKSVFQVQGADAAGQVVVRRQLRRRHVLAFFQKLPPCMVGIEACASSHHWSRELQHGCSDQCCKVKILLANREPSTHGPSRHFACAQQSGRLQIKADIERQAGLTGSVENDPEQTSGAPG
jgi:transposase